MLQNADDNNYTRVQTAVQTANEEPYISFRVYHDMLVVECNEDGFTEEKLELRVNRDNNDITSLLTKRET